MFRLNQKQPSSNGLLRALCSQKSNGCRIKRDTINGISVQSVLESAHCSFILAGMILFGLFYSFLIFQEKCEKYWPDKKAQYGDYVVTLKKEETHADYIVRDFIITLKLEVMNYITCLF